MSNIKHEILRARDGAEKISRVIEDYHEALEDTGTRASLTLHLRTSELQTETLTDICYILDEALREQVDDRYLWASIELFKIHLDVSFEIRSFVYEIYSSVYERCEELQLFIIDQYLMGVADNFYRGVCVYSKSHSKRFDKLLRPKSKSKGNKCKRCKKLRSIVDEQDKQAEEG